MKIACMYSHLNGFEWMVYHKPLLWDEIKETIQSINAEEFKTKVSKEKTMKGKLLYSPDELNKALKKGFESQKWKESRTQYYVTDDDDLIKRTMPLTAKEQFGMISAEGKTPIYSYNQTDFLKERVAIEVQLGKYSFIAYDLFVKHMAFFVGDFIDIGVEILPMKSMQSQMSSGPGYYESALYDILRQGRGIPAVPLILIGIEP